MNLLNFKLLILFFCIPSIVEAQITNETTDRKSKDLWQTVRPHYTKAQFAGSMGVLSIGGGWCYGKQHWETELFLGFVSPYTKEANPENKFKRKTVPTATLKQNYIPWRMPLSKHFLFEPLSCSLYLNTLFHDCYWVNAPSKYQKNYYFFSTKVRTLFALGERIRFNADKNKKWKRDITFFYEISTCDLYLLCSVKDKALSPKDILSLSLGIKVQLF